MRVHRTSGRGWTPADVRHRRCDRRSDQPAVDGLGDPAPDTTLRRDQARALLAGLRARLCRSYRRNHRDDPRSRGAGLRQHHHGTGALGQAAVEGRGRVLRPRFGAFQPGDPGDRQGGVAADGAALEPDHDERCAVWPHRAALRQPQDADADERGAAAARAHLHPLPPRRRRPERRGQGAHGRNQRAARPARHLLQPSRPRRRAGLVPGAR